MNWSRVAFQLAADAIYGAAAQTGHVPPTAYSDHAIERAAGHIEAIMSDIIFKDADPRFEKFHAVIREIVETHERKSRDYGTGDDPYANVRASAHFGVPAWVGAQIRRHDKTIRMQSFLRNGKLANESLEDALLDACVYDIISLLLFREEKAKSV